KSEPAKAAKPAAKSAKPVKTAKPLAKIAPVEKPVPVKTPATDKAAKITDKNKTKLPEKKATVTAAKSVNKSEPPKKTKTKPKK
ncbi:MAG: transcriptional regulator, partial [Fibrobacteres bacterium]|nr:transcriptional regulator [Fibrobacterota bacterium]